MNLRTWLLPLVAAPLLAGAAGAGAIERLAWMAGSWAGAEKGLRLEEHWTAPRGGTMLGMHRDLRAGRTVSFEFFRIVEDSLGVAYLAQPHGAPPTPFRLETLGDKRVVFANPDHDFPRKISYWLGQDGALHARVEGDIGGKLEFEEWRWKPATLK